MSRVYEAWRRTDAASSSEATRPDEKSGRSTAAADAVVVPNEEPRAAHTAHGPATSLFPLRESRAETPAGDGRTAGPWPVVSDSKTRNLTFEELIRDIALDEQRMNL